MATKQKSGLYRAKVKIGVDENGKDIYKYVSGKTKKELEKARADAIAYYIEGTGPAADVLFGPYAINWYKTFKAPNLKPSTQASYRTVLNNHVLPAFGDRNIRAISVADIQKLLNSLSSKASTLTVVAKSILTGVLNSACADRIIQHSPMYYVSCKVSSKPKISERRALTNEERRRITVACQNNPDAAYIALLYYLGLRRGEARGLRWGDIDWHEGLVHVARSIDDHNSAMPGTPKTDSSIRTVPAPKPLLMILDKHRGLPDMYILHGPNNTPMTNHRLNKIWQSIIVDMCGITDITPHVLRHNYITLCWEAGIDVYATARFVGHSNVTTTLSIYTHLSQDREKENAKAVKKAFAH